MGREGVGHDERGRDRTRRNEWDLMRRALAVPGQRLPEGGGRLPPEDPPARRSFDGPRDVSLLLYTRDNPLEPEYVTLNDSSAPSFDARNPTRVIIHGWLSGAQNLQDYREAYLATGEAYNVVLVDWSGPASADLEAAARSSVLVGDYVGRVLNRLVQARGLSPDDLVIVGHSTGGQMAGVVGNRVGGGAPAEVVALDPSNGLYDANPLEDQLDISDAQFVQVIHTNGGGAGLLESKGHADFFPNGGSLQSGCGARTDVDGCSHNRAPTYYIESIISKDFVATRCSSYEDYSQGKCSSNEHAVMGEWTPRGISGTYYLNTNTKSPFAQGQTGL
ncbi:Phospholipase A1 [Gryllus bimaculatus]|nr:Phospholipase A1 [Gryllus bimaculatus]